MSFSRQKPPGIGFVPAYQISGVPFVTSSVANEAGTTPVRVQFPFVTRWVEIANTGGEALRIGFSANGAAGKGGSDLPDDRIYSGSRSEPVADHRNYFILAASASAGHAQGRVRWELRCSEIFLASAGDGTSFSICAGLTTIPGGHLILTGSEGFLGIG